MFERKVRINLRDPIQEDIMDFPTRKEQPRSQQDFKPNRSEINGIQQSTNFPSRPALNFQAEAPERRNKPQFPSRQNLNTPRRQQPDIPQQFPSVPEDSRPPNTQTAFNPPKQASQQPKRLQPTFPSRIPMTKLHQNQQTVGDPGLTQKQLPPLSASQYFILKRRIPPQF